jgi:AsmA protein
VSGALTSRRIDLAALQAPAAQGAAPAAPPAPTAPAAPAAASDGRAIPNLPLPLDALRLFDADLRWQIAELVTPSMPLREVALRLVVEGGKARLDPLNITLPGGRLALRGAADLTSEPPTLQLAASSTGLDLAALGTALQLPGNPTGRLEVDADLRGRGRDLRAVAASAFGHLGIAVTGSQIPVATLQSLTARLRGELPIIGELTNRPLAIACAAGRFDLENGLSRTRALLVDTSFGKVGGEGSASLRDETLAMRLNTDLRLPVPGVSGGLRIRAPVPLGGTFLAPRAEWSALTGAAAAGAATGALGQQLGQAAGPLGQILGGALGGQLPGAGGSSLPDCGSALAAARGGRAGPVPASAAPAEPPAAPAAPAGQASPRPAIPGLPGGLPGGLRNLFGR